MIYFLDGTSNATLFEPKTTDMRVLVYAAGVYAVGIGCTEAFAPTRHAGGETCTGPNCVGPKQGPSLPRLGEPRLNTLRMVGTGVDRIGSAAHDDIVEGKSIYSVAASFEASYSAPSAEPSNLSGDAYLAGLSAERPSKQWTAPVGYTPEGSATHQWTAPVGYSPKASTPLHTPTDDSQAYLDSAPRSSQAKTWQPPVGYTPKAEVSGTVMHEQLDKIASLGTTTPIASLAAAVLQARLPAVLRVSAAPKNKTSWARTLLRNASSTLRPIIGFPGKIIKHVRGFGRRRSADYLASLSSAPSKKWTAPMGYTPKGSRSVQNEGAGAAVVSQLVGGLPNVQISQVIGSAQRVGDLPIAPMSKVVLAQRAPAVLYAASFIGLMGRKCKEVLVGKLSWPVMDPGVTAKPTTSWSPPQQGYVPERLKRSQSAGQLGSRHTTLLGSSWTPPVGYVPERLKTKQAQGISSLAPQTTKIQSTAESKSSWTPPVGYKPPSRSMSAQQIDDGAASDSLSSSAAASKWSPPVGYAPTRSEEAHMDVPVSRHAVSASANGHHAPPTAATPSAAAHVISAMGVDHALAAALAAKKAELEPAYSAKYSPEIEAQRQERLEFYLGLGVPEDEARRLVSRIVAAYVGND